MTTPQSAISVKNLSKVFKVYNHPRDMFWELVTRRPRHKEFWALKDVSFEVARGEVVGVIGRNGSGKSTLLKLITGTLDLTKGKIEINGKVSAILELGTGFNDEYSGRENVFLGGMCAGMSRPEIESKLERIVQFSGLGEVIDRPFKTYSSGMKARLTFSVAVHVDPEILIIDEALATGDAAFVTKSLRHVEGMCKDKGTTALLVSHSMGSLQRLCHRGIYLSKGEVVSDGAIREVIKEYENEVMQNDVDTLRLTKQRESTTGGHARSCRVTEFITRAGGDQNAAVLYTGEEAELIVAYDALENFEDVWVGLELYHGLEGAFVATLTNDHCRSWPDFEHVSSKPMTLKPGKGELVFSLNPLMLGGGHYYAHFSIFPMSDIRKHIMNYGEAILHERYVGNFHVKTRTKLYTDRICVAEFPLKVSNRPAA